MIEVDKKKVLGVLEEISNAMTRIEGERGFITEAIKEASEKHEIDKKILRKMARTYHKRNFSTEVAEQETFQHLYETVVADPS